MSISLKNHEDRISILENKRREVKLVLESARLLYKDKTLIDCGCDWTTYDFIVAGWNIWGTDEDRGDASNAQCDFVTIPVAYLSHGYYFGHYEIYGGGSLSTEDVKVSMHDTRTLSFWTDYGIGRVTWLFLVKN